ncbi:hypothetical protein PHET_11800, partial [Paragonimus heterotremus]
MVHGDTRVQNVFQIHHIASFVEGSHSLKPEEVVRHLSSLHSSKKIEEIPCIVKMDSKGMRVKLEKTKEVVEAFEWNSIRSQAAILNPMDHFQFKFLVLFRLVQFKESNNELHVFSCETIDIAKSFVDSISHHKKEPRKSASELKVNNDSTSNGKLKRGRSEEGNIAEKLNTVVDAYGRHFYMLNRCIDDIESFESRLEKAIKKRANSQE